MASIFAKFFGRTVSEAAAFAAGLATAPTLAPGLRELENVTWAEFPTRPLDPGTAAAVAAEDVDQYDRMATEASYGGFNDARFKDIWGETLNAPGVPQLLELLRRELISRGDLEHGFRKAKLEDRWDAALRSLKNSLLDPAVLAVAIQRGIIPDPGILPVAPPTGKGAVPSFPVFPVDAVKEAAGSGIDLERLSVMVGNVGLPASAQQAASAYFRGIIKLDDYYRAISEGNTRNEWRDAILEQAREIPSSLTGIEGRLRGWLTDAEMYEQTARHGMSKADTDLLFKVHGRPISFRQTFIGRERGGELDGPTDAIDPAFLASLRRSNIQPSFYNLAWAQRYTYPSAFVLRALTSSGDITQARAEQVLLYEGWEPGFAKQVSSAWAGGTHTAGKQLLKAELLDEFEGGFITESELRDHLAALGYQGPELDLEVHLADARRIKGWRDKAITALGKRYVAGTMTHEAADGYLVELGLADADTRGRIIGIWDIEREFK